MNLSIGIVGLPNVGKSTLFNALLKKQQAFVANYPFATIEPNVGIVPVPDQRLEILVNIVAGAKYSKSDDGSWKLDLENRNLDNLDIKDSVNQDQKSLTSNIKNSLPPIIPATVQFVDIAGLVKGASEGAGLGNKFLSHIRETSVIAHVVRAFEDPSVVKEGSVDPKNDYEIVRTELELADLEKGGEIAKKPELIVLNVSESDYNSQSIKKTIDEYSKILGKPEEEIIVISAKIEEELASLSKEDQNEYLKNLGLEASGLERLIQKAYKMLGLISFLTAGEKEVRAWTIKKGTSAVDSAGVIHTDFSKKFIKAEVVSFDNFVNAGGWKKSRELGKTRFEGRDYIVKDGDVIEFKIGT